MVDKAMGPSYGAALSRIMTDSYGMGRTLTVVGISAVSVVTRFSIGYKVDK